mmetsp:Transcript_148627/g.477198  ORF Transcript_148627/g.477198 Transcript_148627/m.477198 type:complete len:223 (+) Transcript_148627:1013-1681(+)
MAQLALQRVDPIPQGVRHEAHGVEARDDHSHLRSGVPSRREGAEGSLLQRVQAFDANLLQNREVHALLRWRQHEEVHLVCLANLRVGIPEGHPVQTLHERLAQYLRAPAEGAHSDGCCLHGEGGRSRRANARLGQGRKEARHPLTQALRRAQHVELPQTLRLAVGCCSSDAVEARAPDAIPDHAGDQHGQRRGQARSDPGHPGHGVQRQAGHQRPEVLHHRC